MIPERSHPVDSQSARGERGGSESESESNSAMPRAVRGFDFSAAMTALCVDLCDRIDELSHIAMDDVLVCIAQARRRTAWGTMAKLTTLRFEHGEEVGQRNGRWYRCQGVRHGGRDMLYLVTFYLPRFQDQTPREKLITVVHELYHISPQFDGDIRRFAGRCHAHTGSQKNYDAHMAVLCDRYLATNPNRSLRAFLELDADALAARHGGIVGLKVAIPKLIPVSEP